MTENLNDNYLSHHGIDGMKWGKRNGPPYPLSRATHNRVVSKKSGATKRDPKTGRFVKGKTKKEKVLSEKKKQKILKDPKKIVKYQEKLTREEIEEALRKIDSVDRVKSRINKRKLFSRRNSGLTRRQRRMARNPATLQRNMHKFSPEDLQKAINYIQTKNNLFDLKIANADKPRKVIQKVSDYAGTTANALNNVSNLRVAVDRFKNKGLSLTPDESRKKWMYLNDPLAYRINNPVQAKTLLMIQEELEKRGIKMDQVSHSDIGDDNFLAHYGVKGMKWRNHIYARPLKTTGRRIKRANSEEDNPNQDPRERFKKYYSKQTEDPLNSFHNQQHFYNNTHKPWDSTKRERIRERLERERAEHRQEHDRRSQRQDEANRQAYLDKMNKRNEENERIKKKIQAQEREELRQRIVELRERKKRKRVRRILRRRRDND